LTSYLRTLFPLIACALSLIILIFQTIRLFRQSKSPVTYTSINSQAAPETQEDDDVSDHDSIAELTLQRTLSRTATSVQRIDKSARRATWTLLEMLALTGQVLVSVACALSRQTPGLIYEPYADLTVWVYVLLLAGVRLVSLSKIWKLPIIKVWPHLVSLYGSQWLLEVIRFRSVLLHPERTTNLIRTSTITEFALSTTLLFIALFAGKAGPAVLLEHEGDLEPSREPLASLASLAMFGWADAIVWRGYNKTLELSDVWDLRMRDKAAAVLAEFRRIARTHTLAIRLLLFFKRKLLLQGMWAIFANLFTFLPTLLLKGILEHLEDPTTTPASTAWLYVILLFVSGVIKTVGDNQALWIGRRVCIQLRAIIVGEIYSKALRRRATASAETDPENPALEANLEAAAKKPKRKPLSIGRKKKDDQQADPAPTVGPRTDSHANNGTIINLMSIDSFKVSEISAYLHFLWASVPVQIVLAVTLVYRILGKSSLAGVCIMVFVMPLNFFIAKSFQRAQKTIMASTDARIHSTNEVLQNIRIIKYFAWEQRFSNQVGDTRRTELKALRNKFILWATAAMIWSAVPILTTFASFFVYTVIEKKSLVPSIAFPALSMFALLRIPLDQLADMVAHVQEAKVSVDRVEKFLNEEETEKYAHLRDMRLKDLERPRIGLDHATLSWTAVPKSSGKSSPVDAFRLINVDVDFKLEELNLIVGPTGSGKTSLLMALLGEMRLLEGHVHVPGGSIRQELRPDPNTGLTEGVAFCAQQAWLVNDTIKENIIFASPFDQLRYARVIAACALERDLEILDAGDQTLVGEKGITLSGGQKQRISLARALYSTARHVFLDDCLSAVDSYTARHIFENAIDGELMQDRTCILVTHNISLALSSSSYIVVLDNGKIVTHGPPDEVMRSGALGEEILKSRPGSGKTSAAPSRVQSNLEEITSQSTDLKGVANEQANGRVDKDDSSRSDGKNPHPRTESKAEGSVKIATIRVYLDAMGPWYFWIVALSAFVATQVGSVATNVWIRQWSNSYQVSKGSTSYGLEDVRHPIAFGNGLFLGRAGIVVPQTPSPESSMMMVEQKVNVVYYLGIYALIGGAYVLTCFSREILLFAGSLHASWQLHQRLLQAVMRAKFRFFDSTPLGQLMNRFSKDVQAIDQEVSPVAMGMINCFASVITVVILISIITPKFLVAILLISCIYIAVGMLYIRSSRDLKRIESVQRSPLYQAFGETLSGVVTIRAYGDESRFITDNHIRVNTHNRPFIYLWATNRWLAVRADLAGALVAFSAGVLVLSGSGFIDSGAAGLSLSYAITFTEIVLWLVRLYGANEQNMNSVERVKEYMEIEQEAAALIPESEPAGNWPSQGIIEFVGYTTSYRGDLGPVLKEVTFNVRGGEKVGIVGRTGAGKSSLALALFRGLEAQAGKILIDGVDIGLIGLQDLREAITIVPQDPTLFSGSLRSNLDPFGLFTDEEIFAVLRRVQLISSIGQESESAPSTSPTVSSATPTLTALPATSTARDAMQSEFSESTLVRLASNSRENRNIFQDLSSSVSESGSNLSQGQRQLLCLARALLKAPKVLVMDEATASIDYATDAKIQDTLRELKDNTIITIAHRLQTIIDYDKVLVLDKGEVVEFDDPWELIRKEDGSFRGMCETSGNFDSLFELARKAWQDRRLVDDD
jgi:ABC-type multidrug transport system fused ATPase/permease subunit